MKNRHRTRIAAAGPSQPTATPADQLERREQAGRAIALLDQLPDRQRDVLYLTACEGLTPAEIGSILDVSSRAVIASLSIARQKIRQMVEPARVQPEVSP